MNKEVEDVLEELYQVEPSRLNEKARRLFDAIMSIADERNLYKQRIDKAIEYINKTQEGFISELKLLNILKGENNE